MSTPPPNPPAEAFAAFVRCLIHAVITRRLMGLFAAPVADRLIDRLRVAKHRLARLAARIDAGTFAPRRVMPRPPATTPHPRPKIPRRQAFGWLRPLLPDAVPAAGYLDHLLHDPAMVALMQAAPAQAARILRPLCWMLRLKPPPILAAPRRRPAPAPQAGPPPAPSAPAPSAQAQAPPLRLPSRPQVSPPKAPSKIRPARLAHGVRARGPPRRV